MRIKLTMCTKKRTDRLYLSWVLYRYVSTNIDKGEQRVTLARIRVESETLLEQKSKKEKNSREKNEWKRTYLETKLERDKVKGAKCRETMRKRRAKGK